MTVCITGKDIHLEYPTSLVFKAVTLGVDTGDRIGIVGRNGDGKTSLLGVLAGTIIPTAGEAVRRSGLTIGMLTQADALNDTHSVAQAIVGTMPEYEWAADRFIREILDALVADVSWDALVGTLSGGQRRRVDLARLLVGHWDVLMLDEPTNHLDLSTIVWLSEHLRSRWPADDGALLIVTHDRWFLDQVCKRMLEVHDGFVEPFAGGYSAYLLARVRRDEAHRTAEQKRRNIARKELAWLSRGAQARATKPKFHVALAQELIADVPPLRNELELKRAAITRLGKQVIDLIGASVCFAENEIIKPTNWIIGPGERIGILGENGAGKTSFLRLLSGQLTPSSGRVKIGASVRFGFLTQRLDELKPFADNQVREVLAQCKSSYLMDGKELSPSKLLERLGFSRTHLQSRICDLSGGQQRRLQLLITLLTEPNVLILDEPGNDLDTDMLSIMEDLLDSWPGTLILVSHDRNLCERVTDNQFALIGGELRHVPQGVDEYLQLLARRKMLPGAARVYSLSTSPAQNKKTEELVNNNYQAKKERASVERKLHTLESKVANLNDQMHKTDPTDYEALIAFGVQQQELQTQIASLEERWYVLSEKLDGTTLEM